MKWEKGQSGNPGGRPKADHNLRELARLHTEAALQTLVTVMSDTEAPPSARARAAAEILDRGHGKPTQYIEELENGQPKQTVDRRELARMILSLIYREKINAPEAGRVLEHQT